MLTSSIIIYWNEWWFLGAFPRNRFGDYFQNLEEQIQKKMLNFGQQICSKDPRMVHVNVVDETVSDKSCLFFFVHTFLRQKMPALLGNLQAMQFL